jgi:FkbM family methyltransferase
MISQDDEPYRHYSVRHKLIALVSQRLFGNITYTVRHGLLTGMRRRGGLGFLPEALVGRNDTAETAFWRRLDLRDQVVFDIGAFEGLLTLFFARQAKQVVSYEPNSRSHQRLVENVRLNGLRNVLIRKVGLGAGERKSNLVWSPTMPGGASAEQAIAGGIQTSGKRLHAEEVIITTLDKEMATASLPAPDLIKVDIEGLELEALEGATRTLRQHSPKLFLEMHGETMSEKQRKAHQLVSFLVGLGYARITHVETARQITVENSQVAAEGHLYCSRAG